MNELPLEKLACRASGDPYFLGFRLAEFCRVHDLDDAALAARLGCAVEALVMIRLCRAPRPEVASYRADVLAVAGKFGLNATALAEAAKPVLASPARDEPLAIPQGVLLAARDRERNDAS